MRILYVVHQFYPQFISGTEQYVLALAKAGRALGEDVRVFTLNPAFGDNSGAGCTDRYEHDGVPVTRYDFDKERVVNFPYTDYHNPAVAAPFDEILEHFRPEVVHFFHCRWHGADRIDQARERGIPVVVHLMDFWYLCPNFLLLRPDMTNCDGPPDGGLGCAACLGLEGVVEALQGAGGQRVAERIAAGQQPRHEHGPEEEALALAQRAPTLRRVLEQADLVISPSRTVRDVLAAAGTQPPNLEIRPYAIEWSLLEDLPEPPAGPVVIGFLGTFAPHKGVDILLEAFKGLPGDLRLRVHGRFGDFPAFDERLKELAAGDERIEFPGTFTRDQLPQVLGGLHALVIPSLWRENTPFVCLEGRAAGLPIIASGLPGMAEAVPEGRGEVFAPGSAEGLRAVLQQTLMEIAHRDGGRLPPDRSIPDLAAQFEDFLAAYRGLTPPLAATATPPTLSVLVPAYNEKETLLEILSRIKASPVDKEIIFVDDGSTDGTREILTRLEAEDPAVKVFFHEHNSGKGAAIRTAIAHATGRICIIQDADLEYDPQDYPALIAPILAGDYRVVYGSRPLCKENHYPLDLFRVGSLLMTVTTNLLYGSWLTDEPTCYKVFDTGLLQSINLRCTGFEFCPEVTAKVRKRGETIKELPIRYRKRGLEEGKKIRAKDLFIGLWTLLKYRFTD